MQEDEQQVLGVDRKKSNGGWLRWLTMAPMVPMAPMASMATMGAVVGDGFEG